MKTIIMSLVFLFTSLFSFAHHMQQLCVTQQSDAGYIIIQWTDVPGQYTKGHTTYTNYVEIRYRISSGKYYDTTIYVPNPTHPPVYFVTKFQWQSSFKGAQDVDFNFGDGYELEDVAITYNSCLPITLNDFNASQVNGNIEVNFTTGMESNVDHFEIQASQDGANWVTVKNIASKGVDGNSLTPLTYQVDVPVASFFAIVAKAGFSLVALLLITGVAVGRNKRIGMVATFALLLTVVACTKTNTEVHYNKSAWVRLYEVDKDGTTKSFQAVQVNASYYN